MQNTSTVVGLRFIGFVAVAALAVAAPSRAEDNVGPDADALIKLGASHYRAGKPTLALDSLAQAQSLVDPASDPALAAQIDNALGNVYRSQGRIAEAIDRLQSGLHYAQQANRRDIEASVLNNLGTSQIAAGDHAAAKKNFEAAQAVANALGWTDMQITACLNIARMSIDEGAVDETRGRLDACTARIDDLESAERRAAQAISAGTILADGQRLHGAPADWRTAAFKAFDNGRQAAADAGDKRAESFALGYIGALYQDELRHAEALDYSRRAAFLAELAAAPEGLYLWQWQIAKALRGMGETEAAIAAYRQSIATLGDIKASLVTGSTTSFRDRVGPVFFELADLLLDDSSGIDDPLMVERRLRAVRDTIEQVKVAEVQEYFNNACMIGRGSAEQVESVASGAAIIYPILFADRTELLVSLPSGLKRFQSDVGRQELTREVRAFRNRIERFEGRHDYEAHGLRLYQWLIEPIIPVLEQENIDTLVMVPDGPLRTIPMSALYDGEQFMIERFAFATTPGLMLTDPQPLRRDNVETLAVGLTEAVQGFSALPNVGTEIENITKLFPATTYLNENFRGEQVEGEIAQGNYNIVHVATHGQFDSDHRRSFLLTYDEKLTLDELRETIGARQYSEEPVELLVLSACETAAGDDRAALGLAGVALQAGARTALATLWFINDESTADMITEFYRQLDSAESSKAEALRAAQNYLLSQPKYRHPSYWAPFLLIGNWL